MRSSRGAASARGRARRGGAPIDAEVLVVAPTLEAGSRVLRRAVEEKLAAFGWRAR
ncbi:MAG: hypothetical protein R3B82_01970 [Sandaracinaceae bacterium]